MRVCLSAYDDDDLDDAGSDLGLVDGEVLDVVCCVLLAVRRFGPSLSV